MSRYNQPLDVALAIEAKIEIMERERPRLSEIAREKALTAGEYEKQLAITLIQLKNASIEEWNGLPVGKIPASIMSKVAQGIANEYKIKADVAESAYKAHVLKLDSIKVEMNGLQSIYKHLDSTGR